MIERFIAECQWCKDPIVWHRGNGGQWLGAYAPRDWTTCYGRSGALARKHQPYIPPLGTRAAVDAWLAW